MFRQKNIYVYLDDYQSALLRLTPVEIVCNI